MTTPEMRKWYQCNCEIDGIKYSCFRPEYFTEDDLTGTAIYPCQQIRQTEYHSFC